MIIYSFQHLQKLIIIQRRKSLGMKPFDQPAMLILSMWHNCLLQALYVFNFIRLDALAIRQINYIKIMSILRRSCNMFMQLLNTAIEIKKTN